MVEGEKESRTIPWLWIRANGGCLFLGRKWRRDRFGGRNVQSSLESTDTWETASRRENGSHTMDPQLRSGDCRAWRRKESQDWMGDLWEPGLAWAAVKERQ